MYVIWPTHKNWIFFSWPFFLLHLYENLSKLPWFPAKNHPPQTFLLSVYVFLLEAQIESNLWWGCFLVIFLKMQTSAFLRPLPPRVGKRLQLGTPSPPKNCGRPLWTAPCRYLLSWKSGNAYIFLAWFLLFKVNNGFLGWLQENWLILSFLWVHMYF